MKDRWGHDVAGKAPSVKAWNKAWERYIFFRDDPLDALAEANEHDEEFVLGPVMAALYSVLGGSRLDAPAVTDNLARARRRVWRDDVRGVSLVEAAELLCRGDVTAAADALTGLDNNGGTIGADFVKFRFAHDLYLHVGAADRRYATEAAVVAAWPESDPHRHYVEGMHAFTLTETGRHHQALKLGISALQAEPLDLWARHALAHVYENTGDTDASMALLSDTIDIWSVQDLLAVHIWWHLALRHLASGDIGTVLEIFDRLLPEATTVFRLCDMTSLLWRAQCGGFTVGDRWDGIADRWDNVTDRYTCAFVDLHAALAFIRRPDHRGTSRFFDGLVARRHRGHEIDDIFRDVANPLIEAFRSAEPTRIDSLAQTVRRIGGSEAQREIITITRETLSREVGI